MVELPDVNVKLPQMQKIISFAPGDYAQHQQNTGQTDPKFFYGKNALTDVSPPHFGQTPIRAER